MYIMGHSDDASIFYMVWNKQTIKPMFFSKLIQNQMLKSDFIIG